jgi:hypothetical protein
MKIKIVKTGNMKKTNAGCPWIIDEPPPNRK